MSSLSLKGFVKGSSWVIFATVITRLSGLVALPILARILSPGELGLYNLVQNTIQTGDGLSRLGADAAIHRNGAQYQTIGVEKVGRLFGVGACLTIVVAGIIAYFLGLGKTVIAINWIGEPQLEPWLGLTAIIIFLTALSNPSWFYLLALHAFRLYSLRNSLVSISGAILSVGLAFGFGLVGAIWGLVLTATIQLISGWWLTLPVLQEKNIKLRCDRFFIEARSILSFGLPFYASNFLSSFIILPLLGYVSRTGGIEELGYLRVAQSLSQLISFLPTAIAPVLISSLSSSLTSDIQGYQKLKSLHLRSLWVLILILTTVISFSLEGLIPMLFGSGYTQAISLSRLTVWMAAISSLSGILNQYVISSGNTRIIALIQTIGLCLTIIFGFILIPIYSSVGLILAQSLATVFTFIAYIKPALSDLSSVDKKAFWFLSTINLILIITSLTLSIMFNNYLIKSIVSISIICIAAILVLTKGFTSEEKSLVFSYIHKPFN